MPWHSVCSLFLGEQCLPLISKGNRFTYLIFDTGHTHMHTSACVRSTTWHINTYPLPVWWNARAGSKHNLCSGMCVWVCVHECVCWGEMNLLPSVDWPLICHGNSGWWLSCEQKRWEQVAGMEREEEEKGEMGNGGDQWWYYTGGNGLTWGQTQQRLEERGLTRVSLLLV